MLTENEAAALYDRIAVPLFRYLLRIIRNRETAEDIVHDSFVKFFEHADRYYSPDRDPAPLIFKIARNRALDLVKSASREQSDAGITALSAEKTPDEAFTLDESLKAVDLCASKLPLKLFQAYCLRRDNELTFPELSKLSGVPERTLKRRVSQAVTSMAECLKKGDFIVYLFFMWHEILSRAYILYGGLG